MAETIVTPAEQAVAGEKEGHVFTVFTIGYAAKGVTPARLKATCTRLGAVVVDVRYSPKSWHRPEWSRRQLGEVLGDSYRHCPALGNANYRKLDAPIRLADPAKGAREVADILVHQPVILLCACFAPTVCHRSVASSLIHKLYGAPVVHLYPHDLAPAKPEPKPAGPENHQLGLFSA
jgi:hypothetical protein